MSVRAGTLVCMHLDDARTLKRRLTERARDLADARGLARPSRFGRGGVTSEDVIGAPTLAVGVSVHPGGYGIAVRYRSDQPQSREVADELARDAGPEVDVRRTGRILSLGHGWAGTPLPVEAAQGETGRVRPLRPGVSIAHVDVTAGTLGAFVTRGEGEVFALSNWHVLAGSPSAQVGDVIVQPGPADGGAAPQDRIGTLADLVPLRPEQAATVDAAVALLDEPEVDPTYPVGVVTTAGAVVGGEQVGKIGRTTAETAGRVSAIELDDVIVDYGELGPLSFDDQIEIESTGAGPFSRGGDSGSLVYREDGVALGLLFAGSETGGPDGTGLTYANPLPSVLEALGVRLAAPAR